MLHAKEKGIPVTVLKAGQVLKFGIDTKMRILAPKSCVVDAYMEIVERLREDEMLIEDEGELVLCDA